MSLELLGFPLHEFSIQSLMELDNLNFNHKTEDNFRKSLRTKSNQISLYKAIVNQLTDQVENQNQTFVTEFKTNEKRWNFNKAKKRGFEEMGDLNKKSEVLYLPVESVI